MEIAIQEVIGLMQSYLLQVFNRDTVHLAEIRMPVLLKDIDIEKLLTPNEWKEVVRFVEVSRYELKDCVPNTEKCNEICLLQQLVMETCTTGEEQ